MDSELGILSWIIFGTLAGWVATMIAGIAQEHGWDDAELENIIVGIIGAVVLLVILHLVRRARSNPLP